LRRTKGRREDVMPLPEATGQAIAAYLRDERPKTRHRMVFARHMTPRERLIGPDLVRKTVRQAYARAGLPYTRSHLLRHTMAGRLLAGGASLTRTPGSVATTASRSRRYLVIGKLWPGGSGSTNWSEWKASTAADSRKASLLCCSAAKRACIKR
jgi:integrase